MNSLPKPRSQHYLLSFYSLDRAKKTQTNIVLQKGKYPKNVGKRHDKDILALGSH